MVELVAGTLRRARSRASRRRVAGVALAVALAAAGILALVRAYTLQDAILPGVTVAGVEVGGLGREDASARIAATLHANLSRPVIVRVGEREFRTTPAELYRLDVAATEEAAFDAGRDSVLSRLAAMAAPFAFQHEVEPVLAVRPRGQARLAARLNRLTVRPVSARVEMSGKSAVVTPAESGTVVDQAAFAEELRLAALSGSGTVTARVTPAEPTVTTTEAARAALSAERVASAPVRIELKDERAGRLSRAELASLVRFSPANGALRVVLARDALGRELEPMVATLTREPVDAGFRVEGKRAYVVRAKPGTTLDVPSAARLVRGAALRPRESGGRVAAVTLTALAAELTTRDARALGIRRQLATFTTDMGVSSSNRIHNVLLMGQYLDGTILEPGETFSFNGTIGPRTTERGFLEGQMILGGLLVPSIGGGVCQVATTIFNAAFETGLPIKERHNHSFFISHYPTGRDATVSWGGPDLVFRNDLDHAILIKAGGNSATFTVSFYGTRQGRSVTATTSTPTNYTSPTLQYAVDPSAPPNSVRTEPGGGPGFDVNVHRVVREEGKVVREDDFFTRYVPQNPTAVYGPGRTPPGPYFTIPATA
jgi:vancomycin resistance protein YoaR